jgi:hypothetical protein
MGAKPFLHHEGPVPVQTLRRLRKVSAFGANQTLERPKEIIPGTARREFLLSLGRLRRGDLTAAIVLQRARPEVVDVRLTATSRVIYGRTGDGIFGRDVR